MYHEVFIKLDRLNKLMLFTDGSVNPHTKVGYGAYLAISDPELPLDLLKNAVDHVFTLVDRASRDALRNDSSATVNKVNSQKLEPLQP